MARERGRGQILELADGSFHIRWFSGIVDGTRKDAGKNVVGTRQDAEAELVRVLAQRAAERAGGGDASPRLKGVKLTLRELSIAGCFRWR